MDWIRATGRRIVVVKVRLLKDPPDGPDRFHRWATPSFYNVERPSPHDDAPLQRRDQWNARRKSHEELLVAFQLTAPHGKSNI
jgi:hypothetical protein